MSTDRGARHMDALHILERDGNPPPARRPAAARDGGRVHVEFHGTPAVRLLERRQIRCRSCGGLGRRHVGGGMLERCPDCGGDGQLWIETYDGDPSSVLASTIARETRKGAM